MKIKTRFSACLAAGAFLALTPAAFAQFSIAGLVEGANSVEVAPASVGSTVDGRPMIGVMLTTEGGAPAIQSVIKKSPAEKAGLEAGDVIRSVGDKKVKSLDDLQGLLGGLSVGDEVQIGVDRDGNRKTLTMTLADSEDLDIPVGEMIEIGDAPKAKSLKEVKRKEKSEKKTNKTNKANKAKAKAKAKKGVVSDLWFEESQQAEKTDINARVLSRDAGQKVQALVLLEKAGTCDAPAECEAVKVQSSCCAEAAGAECDVDDARVLKIKLGGADFSDSAIGLKITGRVHEELSAQGLDEAKIEEILAQVEKATGNIKFNIGVDAKGHPALGHAFGGGAGQAFVIDSECCGAGECDSDCESEGGAQVIEFHPDGKHGDAQVFHIRGLEGEDHQFGLHSIGGDSNVKVEIRELKLGGGEHQGVFFGTKGGEGHSSDFEPETEGGEGHSFHFEIEGGEGHASFGRVEVDGIHGENHNPGHNVIIDKAPGNHGGAGHGWTSKSGDKHEVIIKKGGSNGGHFWNSAEGGEHEVIIEHLGSGAGGQFWTQHGGGDKRVIVRKIGGSGDGHSQGFFIESDGNEYHGGGDLHEHQQHGGGDLHEHQQHGGGDLHEHQQHGGGDLHEPQQHGEWQVRTGPSGRTGAPREFRVRKSFGGDAPRDFSEKIQTGRGGVFHARERRAPQPHGAHDEMMSARQELRELREELRALRDEIREMRSGSRRGSRR